MILPGLSGSYLLLLMGNYTLIMVDSVNALYFTLIESLSFDFTFINDSERLYLLKVLILFTLGSIFGLVFLSNVLSSLLKNYKTITISIIVGFIAGSLIGVWPWKDEDMTEVYHYLFLIFQFLKLDNNFKYSNWYFVCSFIGKTS